jgi:ribosomal protein L16/L10AE
MFDRLVDAAVTSRAPAAVAAWARVENAACARRLLAMADELERMLAADGSLEREQWCLDNWDAVAASVAAAQNVSLGVASHQLLVADGLRRRLPRVAEVFAAGTISYRMITAVVSRTRLVHDRDAMAKVDTEIAAHIVGWGSLSVDKAQNEIDYWIDRYDPAAVRRTEYSARGRYADVRKTEDGSGTADVEARLLATDADALDQRLDAMARAVCANDPRTLDQGRSDALGAIGHGADRLTCGCGSPDCEAAEAHPNTVVVHVITHEESLTDDTPALLDGREPSSPIDKPLREMTIREALTPPPTTDVIATTPPGALLGGGMLPAPLLAAKIAATAKVVPIVHPGDALPERRYLPTAVLAMFVRCRDMTCRFPGCDEPSHHCDIDHTIAYPDGPTQASNLKCLCRKHHLLKTFGGWHDQQAPDGIVIWTSPHGQSYTTHPGSRLLFPILCQPTAPVTTRDERDTDATRPNRGLMMPRRIRTRAQNRTQAIIAERRQNEAAILQASGNACDETYFPSQSRPAGDHDPPPF